MSRTYVIGLPVVVEVHEDGTVTYEVDKSETVEGMWEHFQQTDQPLTEEQVEADVAIVEAHLKEA